MKFCPQCGTLFGTDARFCIECGFDRSTIEASTPEIESEAEVISDASPAAPIIQGDTSDKNAACPQCGTMLETGDFFCPECGFNSKNFNRESPSPPPFISQNTTSKNHEKETGNQTAPPDIILERRISGTPGKTKRSWLVILLVVAGIAGLGIGGWFVYNTYFVSPKGTVDNTKTHTEVPETANTDAVNPPADATEELAEATHKQPENTTKPLSKIDQELARYREKEKNNNAGQTKREKGIKASPNAAVNDILSKVIHEVGRKEDAKSKKPKNPAKLTLQNPTMIVRITTDHYNEGMGTAGGGTISIKDRDGNLLGTYKAKGKTGKDGAPNAKWVVEPNEMFEKGTYYIWDSDFSTWSKNLLGNGFIIVEGYEVK